VSGTFEQARQRSVRSKKLRERGDAPDPIIVITHAAFDENRRHTIARLTEQLQAEGLPFCVSHDNDRNGSLWCWKRAMRIGRDSDATHIVWLPDDAILAKGFGIALRKAIEAQPDQVFDCVVNREIEPFPTEGWYTTHDGYVGGAGVMPRALLEEHLAWREEHIGWARMGEPGYMGNDYGVNVWAMATGRLIWKTAVSLIDHDTSIPSLDGNDDHDNRRPLNFRNDVTDLEGWDKPPVHIGRTYTGTHWTPIFEQARWGAWDLEASYLVHRHGRPLSDAPHVFIATPAYQAPELAYLQSVARTIDDLRSHGIEATHYMTGGDSLVTRGRHTLVHDFLCSPATHLLQWDADLECLDEAAVRTMIATGRPIVGGAYPFRDGSGGVVANLRRQDVKAKRVDIRGDNTIPVSEVGTGFLLTRRDVLIDMQKRHPELLYEADLSGYAGAPMWALFDVALEPTPQGRKRYASEDWRFCSIARADGYEVCIYYPPEFRHWGKKGHEGHVVRAWKMGDRLPEAAE
jgi:hypothetical protein